jgi:hypothetical protein
VWARHLNELLEAFVLAVHWVSTFHDMLVRDEPTLFGYVPLVVYAAVLF